MGLWLLDVPAEYGGAGLSLLARCVIQEEIARTKALPFRNNPLFGPGVGPILYECGEAQRERFLYPVIRGELKVCFAQTEPDAGSDPADMRTRAVRDGDHYVLNGTKRFITEAGDADFAQVICVTDPAKRSRGGISVLMVGMKSPGVSLVRQWPTMMGDKPWEINFDNVHVPLENRIGEEGRGFELGQKWLTLGRVKGHGARCVGIAQRALDMAMEYACHRVTFGQPLADRQAVQFMIADSAIEVRAARLMVYETAWKADQGLDVRNDSYMTKIFCTEMASRVVDRAIQIHGGIGLTRELPLEYWYRQLRSVRITEGVTEVLRWRLARNLMRA
jgi:acyl-CoA dehydrogenase